MRLIKEAIERARLPEPGRRFAAMSDEDLTRKRELFEARVKARGSGYN